MCQSQQHEERKFANMNVYAGTKNDWKSGIQTSILVESKT
jgi:hypothetical protein